MKVTMTIEDIEDTVEVNVTSEPNGKDKDSMANALGNYVVWIIDKLRNELEKVEEPTNDSE